MTGKLAGATTSRSWTSRRRRSSAGRARTSSSPATARTSCGARRSAACVVNKEGSGSASFNRHVAGDALFAPTQSFSVHSFIAKTAFAGHDRRRAGVPRPRAVPEPQLETFAEFTDIERELQRRGRLRPAHGHPDVQAPHRAESAPRRAHPRDGADGQHDLHDRSEQPPADAPRPPHARHAVPERRVPERLVQQLVRSARSSRSASSPASPFRRAPTASTSGAHGQQQPGAAGLRAVRVLAADLLQRHAHRHRTRRLASGPTARRRPSSRSSATTSICRGARSS